VRWRGQTNAAALSQGEGHEQERENKRSGHAGQRAVGCLHSISPFCAGIAS